MQVTKILITGNHDHLPAFSQGKRFEWTSVPVLEFNRIAVAADILEKVEKAPFDWIIFTSPRAVRFWSETLMEQGMDFPVETQVACIGEETADAAGWDGFTADFYPSEPGSKKFLEEFTELIGAARPSILIPMAEEGRPTIKDTLAASGCQVTAIPLYRTSLLEKPAENLSESAIREFQGILFTSPSSVDGFLKHYRIPNGAVLVAIGEFTAGYLKKLGFQSILLPGGSFERIGEVLC